MKSESHFRCCCRRSDLLALFTLSLICNSAFAQDPPATQIAKEIGPDVVKVRALGSGPSEVGFGFIVGQLGSDVYIATAYHIVSPESDDPGASGAKEAEVVFFSDQGAPMKAAVLGTHLERDEGDLAVLRVRMPERFQWRPRCLAGQEMYPKGTDVWFVGKNQKWESPPVPGFITSDGPLKGRITIETSEVLPGTSGAPLISAEGIIGMVQNATQNASAALTIDAIADAIKKWNYPWNLQPRPGVAPWYAERHSNVVSPSAFRILHVSGDDPLSRELRARGVQQISTARATAGMSVLLRGVVTTSAKTPATGAVIVAVEDLASTSAVASRSNRRLVHAGSARAVMKHVSVDGRFALYVPTGTFSIFFYRDEYKLYKMGPLEFSDLKPTVDLSVELQPIAAAGQRVTVAAGDTDLRTGGTQAGQTRPVTTISVYEPDESRTPPVMRARGALVLVKHEMSIAVNNRHLVFEFDNKPRREVQCHGLEVVQGAAGKVTQLTVFGRQSSSVVEGDTAQFYVAADAASDVQKILSRLCGIAQ